MSNSTRTYPNIGRLTRVALISLAITVILVGITALLPNPVTMLIAKFTVALASSMAFAGLALSIAFYEKD